MPHLGMEFLGGFHASLDGTRLTEFESSKVRALLAYLAVESQRPYPRESLAALLWPDWPDRAALSNLRYALSDLRKVTGDRGADPPYLLISREAIQFNAGSDHYLDVSEFSDLAGSQGIEQLERAVSLYKGEFLEGFSLSEAAPFEDWARLKGEQLRRCYLETLHRLAGMLESEGKIERALGYAWRLVEVEPLDEGGQRQVMRLLALSGQRGAALNQFERLKMLLRKDLEVEPETETIRLQHQIRHQEVPVLAGRMQAERISEVSLPVTFAPLKAADVHQHNLPVYLTSFIGREREIGEIKKLLAGNHLLTLTGIGGAGKTRLAVQTATDLVDEFPGGVRLVELAPLRDFAQVEGLVASILGVHEQPDRLLSDLLVEYVRERNLLIILDNCEHLVDACAQLADQLLRAAPKLKILSTSRVPLGLAGEVNYSVPPLALPDPQKKGLPLALGKYEAVRLFIERTISIQPAFSLTDENAPAVAQICQHLDGIPLAIELAAARTRFLSPDQIAARLGDRFNLLKGGSRTALPRQRTLRATMDWSYDLLTEAECTLFKRLSVFTGSFSLEAVEAICADEISGRSPARGIQPFQVLDLLGALVDHSLVSVQGKKAEARYSLLETVRQYALEKLESCGELQALQDRHLAFYLELAERGFPHISTGQPIWMARFESEYENLRAAIEYAIVNSLESAIRFQPTLLWFTDFTHRQRESYNWVTRILAATESCPPGKMRAMALFCAGARTADFGDSSQGQAYLEASLEMAKNLKDMDLVNLVIHDLLVVNNTLGNWEQLHDYAEQHLAISRELGDNAEVSCALWSLGEAVSCSGDIQAGRRFFEQSLEIARQTNNLNSIAFDLYSLAGLARKEGAIGKAIEFYIECAQIRRDIGYQVGLADALIRLGQVLLQEGDAIQSRALAEQSLEIYRELKIISMQVYCLNMFAGAAGIDRQEERAARLFGAAEAAVGKINVETDEFYHMTYDPIISAVRDRLGEAAFNTAWAEGRTLTLDQALEYGLK